MKLRLLPLVTLPLLAATPPGYTHLTPEQIAKHDAALPGKMTKHKIAVETLASWGNSSFVDAHREGDGEAELHKTKADIMIIRSGDGFIVIGGSIPDPRATEPSEVRGSRIEGGEKQPLHPGDVLRIPSKVPHQILVEPGHKLDYFAIKVSDRAQ